MDDPRIEEYAELFEDFQSLKNFTSRFTSVAVVELAKLDYLRALKNELDQVTRSEDVQNAFESALIETRESMNKFSEVYGAGAWSYLWEGIEESLKEVGATVLEDFHQAVTKDG